MKKLLLLAVAIGGFAVAGKTQPPPSTVGNADPNAPVITFVTDSISFGTITQGTTVTETFKFTNTGKTPLVITDATATCGCTHPTFTADPIPPGKTGEIKVTFNSTGKMGPQDKVITITSNNKTGTTYVHLIGTVTTPPPAPAPGSPDPSRGSAPTGGN